MTAALPASILFLRAETKSRAGPCFCACSSIAEGGMAFFAAATSARFTAMMRSRMVKASVSPQFPLSFPSVSLLLPAERDVLVELAPGAAAADRTARRLDTFLVGLRQPAHVDRSTGVQRHYVVRRPGLVAEHREHHLLRLVHALDLDRAAVVELQAELRGMQRVLVDLAVGELAYHGFCRHRDL